MNLKRTSYRKWAYLATILTGFSALSAQVIWQRYLAVLVGSEARSLTLVVAVFLSGLALGYYVFGFITERKKWSRAILLKLYGYIEFITAVYIIVFFLYFEALKTLSFNSPDYFVMDVLVSLLALLLPTFLMGASIPLLTATLPDSSPEVNTVHAKIYGWNTLGACFGCLVSGFYLIPVFGLNVSLVIVGVINFLASLVFVFNPLQGDVYKRDEFPVVPSVLSNRFYILFTFLTGAVIISFEVFFVRILHLSVYGAKIYNFPLILSIFVGGLALGSLSVEKKNISIKHLLNQLLSAVLLMGVLFWIIPYWSLWISNIRGFIGYDFLDYVFFQIILFLFIFIFLFPGVFCVGKLLPLAYTLMKKNVKNYGRICGSLYFFNTLGTVMGAIGLGYLALYVFNIDTLFKMNICIISLLGLVIAFFEKKKMYTIALIALAVIFAFVPLGWNKGTNYPHHYINEDSNMTKYKKWFSFPKADVSEVKKLYFNDGPNTTVVTAKKVRTEKTKMEGFLHPLFPISLKEDLAYNVITNGKGDGDSLGEFSVFFLIPSLTWLFAPPRGGGGRGEGLSTVVVGLGTGVSSGVLGNLKDVKTVSVLEISPKVIESVKLAPYNLNFGVSRNPKVNFIKTDAFKYFTKKHKKFDIIISQPSNVWVVGVENLFSLEFYKLVSRSLSEKGVLGQWLQTYSMDKETIAMVLRTVKRVFPYAEVYRIGFQDILIVASQKPLNHSFLNERFFDPFFYKILQSFGFQKKEDIYLTQVLDSRQYEQFVSFTSKESKEIQSLTRPKLSYRADKDFFMDNNLKPFDLLTFFMSNGDKTTNKRREAFQNYKNNTPELWEKKCPKLSGFRFFCSYMNQVIKEHRSFLSKKTGYQVRLKNYAFLRRHGFIKSNVHFLNEFFLNTLETKYMHEDAPLIYVKERIQDSGHEIAYTHIALLREKGILNEEKYQFLKNYIDSVVRIKEGVI